LDAKSGRRGNNAPPRSRSRLGGGMESRAGQSASPHRYTKSQSICTESVCSHVLYTRAACMYAAFALLASICFPNTLREDPRCAAVSNMGRGIRQRRRRNHWHAINRPSDTLFDRRTFAPTAHTDLYRLYRLTSFISFRVFFFTTF
jgi:hypothetical protein